MLRNELLEQVTLNGAPNFVSMQGISDWLYNKTANARIDLQKVLDGEDGLDTDYYQAGCYSIRVEDLRTIFNDVTGDINQTFNVLDINTGQYVDVSGDDITDQIASMFTSNEIVAAGLEVLGSSGDDLPSMHAAFTARVESTSGKDALKSDYCKVVQKSILDGNGSIKGKVGNLISLLSVSSKGQDSVESEFSKITGATPSAIWSNVIWPTVASCVSTLVQTTATILGGIFGIAGNAVLTVGKAIGSIFSTAVNPNLVNMFSSHSIRGSLNILNESGVMSSLVFSSSSPSGQTRGIWKSIFQIFHSSSQFQLGNVCCLTIPGGYILLCISQWSDSDNFTGQVAIAPRVGNTNVFDHFISNKIDENAGTVRLEGSGFYPAYRDFLATDLTQQPNLNGSAADVKNVVAAGVTASLAEMSIFLQTYDDQLDDNEQIAQFNYIWDDMFKYSGCTNIGASLIADAMQTMCNYKYTHTWDSSDESWVYSRENISDNPRIKGSTYTAFRSYEEHLNNPNYSNADILWLSRAFTPVSCASNAPRITTHDDGNVLDIWQGVLAHVARVFAAGPDEYYPHIWLANVPMGYIGIRSDKTIAAIYYANLAAAVAITLTTTISITMAIAFRGAKKKAYVYRGYADNLSWTTARDDKKGIKECWKANRRAIRWEKIAGTFDAGTESSTTSSNALAGNLAVTEDPAGIVTAGGTLYGIAQSAGYSNSTLDKIFKDTGQTEQGMLPDVNSIVNEIKELIK